MVTGIYSLTCFWFIIVHQIPVNTTIFRCKKLCFNHFHHFPPIKTYGFAIFPYNPPCFQAVFPMPRGLLMAPTVSPHAVPVEVAAEPETTAEEALQKAEEALKTAEARGL